jgi:hypothetical protein
VELLIVSILNDHTLHDLESTLHRCGVKRVLNSLNSLLDGSLIFLILHLLLEIDSLDLFISCHVSIKDLPLSSLEREVSLDGGISLNTTLLQRKVEGLA